MKLPKWWKHKVPWAFMDCIKGLKKIPDSSVDLIIADPPFNLGKDYGDKVDDSRTDYFEWCELWIEECFRILKETGSFYHMNYPNNIGMLQCIMDKHGVFKNMIIWKNTKMPLKTKYVVGYQPILYYTKIEKGYTFNRMVQTKRLETFIPGIKKKKQDMIAQLTDIWDDIQFINAGCIPNKEAILQPGTTKKAHPCQMPVALVDRMILFSSNEGDVVLDPFLGSGVTLKGCKRNKRIGIGFEINAEYEWIIKKQYDEAQSRLDGFKGLDRFDDPS